MKTSSWLIRKTGAVRRFRLYCFCYAGGNAATYMPWQAALGPDIEVCAIQLPGRGVRLLEQPYQDMESLVRDLVPVIANDSNIPCAFFGHSMGALVAFEVARRLSLHQLAMPLHFFASGTEAPQFRGVLEDLHELPRDELVEKLRAYNGTPPEIIEHRELMELVLPTIRASEIMKLTILGQTHSPTRAGGTQYTRTLSSRLHFSWPAYLQTPCEFDHTYP